MCWSFEVPVSLASGWPSWLKVWASVRAQSGLTGSPLHPATLPRPDAVRAACGRGKWDARAQPSLPSLSLAANSQPWSPRATVHSWPQSRGGIREKELKQCMIYIPQSWNKVAFDVGVAFILTAVASSRTGTLTHITPLPSHWNHKTIVIKSTALPLLHSCNVWLPFKS